MVTHTSNPNTWDAEDCEVKVSMAYTASLCLKKIHLLVSGQLFT
jgi:hypothetical protein